MIGLRTAGLERASRAFGEAITAETGPVPTVMIGVEHEFRVLEAGEQVDARSLIHGLGVGQRDLDPADPFAYRLPDGSVVTCDGREIEIAIPPVPVEPGFAAAADARATAARREVAARLGGRRQLVGYSTHISVSVPDDRLANVLPAFVLQYSAPLMLLLDGPAGVGLLVRPRPGRLELGGSYATGRTLRTALVFAVGATLACDAGQAGDAERDALVLQPRIEPARDRFGVYLDRTAFGGDLYRTGRATPLPLRGGDHATAQVALVRAWTAARAHLAPGRAAAAELSEVDDVVHGSLVLPIEALVDPARTWDEPTSLIEPASMIEPASLIEPTAYGLALGGHSRPEFDLAPVMLTWGLGVFLVAGARRAFAAVPGIQLSGFVAALHGGRLDEPVGDYLRQRPGRRQMSRPDQAFAAGLWDRYRARRYLLPVDPPRIARKPIANFAQSAALN